MTICQVFKSKRRFLKKRQKLQNLSFSRKKINSNVKTWMQIFLQNLIRFSVFQFKIWHALKILIQNLTRFLKFDSKSKVWRVLNITQHLARAKNLDSVGHTELFSLQNPTYCENFNSESCFSKKAQQMHKWAHFPTSKLIHGFVKSTRTTIHALINLFWTVLVRTAKNITLTVSSTRFLPRA